MTKCNTIAYNDNLNIKNKVDIMNIDTFNFNLPSELIAQSPLSRRDSSKLMVCNPIDKTINHIKFSEIVDQLDSNSVLVLNNTKVINARLKAKKTTGASIEVFLLEEHQTNEWSCLIKPTKRIHVGDTLLFNQQLSCKVTEKGQVSKIVFSSQNHVLETINKIGAPPLPPYIKCDNPKQYEARYQTVFAKEAGSVAAPTAGLHFTDDLLDQLKHKGVKIEYVTLHVGYGTFKGIETENIDDHLMHHESYYIEDDVAERLNIYKQEGKKIICVGTTSARTLETACQNTIIQSGAGSSNLFIKPGYSFKFIDALITNFHLPKSSLFVLVSTIAGIDFMAKAYQEAIQKQYRFYSFGDAMYITQTQ